MKQRMATDTHRCFISVDVLSIVSLGLWRIMSSYLGDTFLSEPTAYYMTLHSSAALPSCSKWKLVFCCSARLCFGENYSHFIVPYKEDVYLPFVLSHSYTKKFEYWTIWIWHFSNLGPGSFAVSLKSLQVMLDLRRFIFEFKDFHKLFPLLQC